MARRLWVCAVGWAANSETSTQCGLGPGDQGAANDLVQRRG